ncbi:MAG: hypothetical protein K1W28_06320 [Lachnospiraceae bacterium]|jgi:hypothetical protein
MLDFETVDRLSRLLKKLPPSGEPVETAPLAIRQGRALGLVEALIAGRSGTAAWQREFSDFCGLQAAQGVYIKENSGTDEELLRVLLDACGEEVLEALLLRYGSRSRIGRRIEELRGKAAQASQEVTEGIRSELKENHRSFYQLLAEKIDRKGYRSDAEYYERIHFSRQLFSKLRKPDYTLSKNNVLWLTAGLGLDYAETMQLMEAAGYTFRRTSRRDTIISYVIRHGEYTLDSLNEMLCFFGEKTLGCLE